MPQPWAKLTLTLADEVFARLERTARYNDMTVEEYAQLRLSWRGLTVAHGSVPLSLVIPEADVAQWDEEARRRRWTVQEWVRRMANYVVSTGISGGLDAPAGQVALTYLLSCCEWCQTELPGQATIRRRFCSDRCRVSAWRGRRRHLAA